MRAFAVNRPDWVRAELVVVYQLAGTADLTISNADPRRGDVTVNTIDLAGASYPWTGTYFQGIPVTVTAVPAPGFCFAGWEGDVTGTDNPLVIVPTDDVAVTPLFLLFPDLDGNGSVGFGDLLTVILAWGPCPGCPADLTDDGVVDFADLLFVITAWGPCGP